MSVDSVQSSNTGAYTLGGAALGAAAGGSYGYWMAKPWLKEGAPNDAFYKTVAEKALKGEKNAAEKAQITINESIVNAKNADELAKAQADQQIAGLKSELASATDDAVKTARIDAEKAHLKGALEKLDEKTFTNKADLLKKLEEAKTADELVDATTAVKKSAIGTTDEALKAAQKTATESLAGAKSMVDKGKSVAEKVFDTSKKEFNFEGVAEDAKKQINEAMSSMKKSAALKWAAIGAVVLGVLGFITAKCTAKSYPVAAAKLDEQA